MPGLIRDAEHQARLPGTLKNSFPAARYGYDVATEGSTTIHAVGVGVVIRFPVDRQQRAEVDERVTRELMKNLNREPKLKLVSSGNHSITVRTDLAAA
jgi:hypothetical protein